MKQVSYADGTPDCADIQKVRVPAPEVPAGPATSSTMFM